MTPVKNISEHDAMTDEAILKVIKTLHTGIWVFFNVVIFYMLYAVTLGELDIWLWIGFGFVTVEGLILLIFKWYCPLTLLARKYSSSDKDNFDIYLPNWLAKHTKTIYTSLFIIIVILTFARLVKY